MASQKRQREDDDGKEVPFNFFWNKRVTNKTCSFFTDGSGEERRLQIDEDKEDEEKVDVEKVGTRFYYFRFFHIHLNHFVIFFHRERPLWSRNMSRLSVGFLCI